MSGPRAAWETVTLKEIVPTIRNGIFARRPNDHGCGERILRISAVRNGRVDLGHCRTVEGLTSDQVSKFALNAGDILITRYNGSRHYVGIPGVVPPHDGRVLHPDKLIRLVPDPARVDAKFLAYQLQGSAVRAFLEPRIRTTAGQSGISGTDVRDIPLVLPEIAEQQRVVELLEDHLSRLDAAETYLASALRGAEALEQGILLEAMRGAFRPSAVGGGHSREAQLALRSAEFPLGGKRGRPLAAEASYSEVEWPSSWVRVSLEEATHPERTISYGILKPGPDLPEGVPYVRVLNMRGDVLSLQDLHRTTPAIAQQYERAALRSGDVLISIRGTYGRVVLVPDSLTGGNITQDTARLSFVGPILPEFAAAYLRSPDAQAFLKRVARGVAVKGVNIGDLRTMPFPIPPLSEQQAILNRLSTLLSETRNAVEVATATRQRSSALRRTLLAVAFEGKLTGRRADDAVLEERVDA